jgi:TonB family protein
MAFDLRNVCLSAIASLAIPVSAFAQTAPLDAGPPGWVRVDVKQCPPNSLYDTVPENVDCVPSPTQRCPNKVVVMADATCPDPNAVSSQVVNRGQPAKPNGNPGNWVPSSSYPRDALRFGIEGTVGFILDVGADGKPSQCTVINSSGHDSLDWAACENLMRRAQFTALTNEKGEAEPSRYSNRVRWTIPEKSRPKSIFDVFRVGDQEPYSVATYLDLVVNADGSIASCDFDLDVDTSRPDMILTDEARAAMCARPVTPLKGINGQPVKSRFRFRLETQGEIVNEEDKPAVNPIRGNRVPTRRPRT